MHTIRKITKTYSVNAIAGYFSTLMDMLLNEIFNNIEDVLHYECMITYKDLLEKMYSSQERDENGYVKNRSEGFFNYIERVFRKCEDLSFSTENIKNTSYSKDLLLILCEIDGTFKERTFKLALKLISTYSESQTIIFLKNADAFIYFLIKKDDKSKSLQWVVESNAVSIKSCLSNLLKKSTQNNDDLINIINIVASFITRTSVFKYDEINSIFNIIFQFWTGSDHTTEIYLSRTLNEISTVYSDLNCADSFIKEMSQSFTNYCNYFFSNHKERNEILSLQTNNNDYFLDLNMFYKKINFLNEHFSNPTNSFQILNFYFTIHKKLGVVNFIPSNISNFIDTIQKVNSSLVLIFEKYYKELVTATSKVLHKSKIGDEIVPKVLQMLKELLNTHLHLWNSTTSEESDKKVNSKAEVNECSKLYIYKVILN